MIACTLATQRGFMMLKTILNFEAVGETKFQRRRATLYFTDTFGLRLLCIKLIENVSLNSSKQNLYILLTYSGRMTSVIRKNGKLGMENLGFAVNFFYAHARNCSQYRLWLQPLLLCLLLLPWPVAGRWEGLNGGAHQLRHHHPSRLHSAGRRPATVLADSSAGRWMGAHGELFSC
jgi:hypothetical protein